MATETYIPESISPKKGEREDDALLSELLDEKVKELVLDKVKQLESRPNQFLETSNNVAKTVNTQLEGGTFFQALSVPMVTTDEKNNIPERKSYEDEQVEVVKMRESIEENTEETRPTVKTEKKMEPEGLLHAVTTDVSIPMQTESQEETAEKEEKNEEANDSDDGQKEKPGSPLVKNVYEETGSEKPESEGVKLSDGLSTRLNEKETPILSKDGDQEKEQEIDTSEKDQGGEDVTSSPNEPCEDINETKISQHDTKVVYFEEQGLIGSPKEILKEETEEKSIDAQEKGERLDNVLSSELLEEKVSELPSDKVKQLESRPTLPLETSSYEPENVNTQQETDVEVGKENAAAGSDIGTDESETISQALSVPVVSTDENDDVPESCEATITEDPAERKMNEVEPVKGGKPNNDERVEVIDSKEASENEPQPNTRDDMEVSQIEVEAILAQTEGSTVSNKDERMGDSTNTKTETAYEEDLQGKSESDESKKPKFVKTGESIEEDTEEIRPSVKIEEKTKQEEALLHPITTDVSISLQTESQKETTETEEKKEEVSESDDCRKEKLNSPLVKEVCEKNALEKVESEEGVKLPDISGMKLNEKEIAILIKDENQEKEQEQKMSEEGQGEDDVTCSQNVAYEEELQGDKEPVFVKARDSIKEDTEEIRTSVVTEEKLEQEGLLHAITTDVSSSTQTESQEETTKNEEKIEEMAIESDGDRKEKSYSPSVKEVCEETGSEKIDFEEVELSGCANVKLNEKAIEILSKDQDQEKELELNMSEEGQGEDDVTCSHDVASEEELQEKNHDEGKDPDFAKTREEMEEIRSGETEEKVAQEGLFHAVTIDASISTQTEAQEGITENEEIEEEAIESDDGRKKSDSPSAKEVCEEIGSEKVESEEGVELSSSSDMKLNEKSIASKDEDQEQEKEQDINMLEKDQGEDDVTCSQDEGKEPQIVKTRKSIDEDTKGIGSSVETEENLEQEEVLHEIASDVSISTQTESHKETIENEEKNKEEVDENDDGQKERYDSSLVKGVSEETSLENVESEERLELSECSSIKLNEKAIAIISKDEDQEKEQEVNMLEKGQGVDDVTCSQDVASEEELQEKNHDGEGKQHEFVKARESIEEHTEEIRIIETKEKVEQEGFLHASTTDVSMSTQTETQEEATENEEKNEEEAIESVDGQMDKSNNPLVKEACEETGSEKAESEEGVELSESSNIKLNEKAIEALSKDDDQEKEQKLNKSEKGQGGDDVTCSQDVAELQGKNHNNEDKLPELVKARESNEEDTEETRSVETKENVDHEGSLHTITTDVSISTQTDSQEETTKNEEKIEEEAIESDDGQKEKSDSPFVKEDYEDTSSEKVESERVELSEKSSVKLNEKAMESLSEDEDQEKEQELNMSEEGQGEDEVTCSQDVTSEKELEGKNKDGEGEEPEIVKAREIIAEDTEEIESTETKEKVEQEELLHAISTQPDSQEETTENKETNEEEAIERNDGQMDKSESPSVKEVYEEAGSEKAESEEGVKISDSSNVKLSENAIKILSKDEDQEKEQELNMSEEGQGEHEVTCSLDVASKVELEGKNHSGEDKEPELVTGEKEILKEETEDRSIDAQVVSEQCESGTEDRREQKPEESVNTTLHSFMEIKQDVEGKFPEDEADVGNRNEEAKISEIEFVDDLNVTHQVEETETGHTKDELKPMDDQTQDDNRSSEGLQPRESEDLEVVIRTPEETSCNEIEDDRMQLISSDPTYEKTDPVHVGAGNTGPLEVNIVTELGENSKLNEDMNVQNPESKHEACEAGDEKECETSGGTHKTSPQNKDEANGEIPQSHISDQILEDSSAPILESQTHVTTEVSELIKGIPQYIPESQSEANKETDPNLEVENQASRTEDESELKDEVILTEKMALEPRQPKEQIVEEIQACLTKTISERAEDGITKKDEDSSPNSLEQTNDNGAEEEKCIPDGRTREIEVSTLEHELEEQNDGPDEVPQEKSTDLKETTAVGTSTEDHSTLGKSKAESENLPTEDLEYISDLQNPEVVPVPEDSNMKEECLISAIPMYTDKHNQDEENGTGMKEISSEKKIEWPTEIEQVTEHPSITCSDATLTEEELGGSSKKENITDHDRCVEDVYQDSIVDDTISESNPQVTKEANVTQIHTERKTGDASREAKPLTEEISNPDPIPVGNPEVTEAVADSQIGQEDLQAAGDISSESKASSTVGAIKRDMNEGTEQSVEITRETKNYSVDEAPKEEIIPALEDTTAFEPQVNLSNIESTDSPSDFEKLPIQTLEPVCEAQSPEVSNSEDAKVKEECLVSKTAEHMDENNVEEEHENVANDISSAEKEEQTADSEQVAEQPSILCHDAVLIEENLEPHGEFKPISESLIEDKRNETTPQPQKSDTSTEENELGRSSEHENFTSEGRSVEDPYQDSIADGTTNKSCPQEMKEENVKKAPKESDEVEWSNTNTEAKALTEENLEPHGDFKPILESVIEDQRNETTPQLQKSDTSTEENELGRSREHENITSEGRSVEDPNQDSIADGPQEMKEENVKQALKESDKVERSETNTEAKALTEENPEPFGELKPVSEPMSEEQTSEATPQPEESSITSGNSMTNDTLESKLEDKSDKDSIDVKRDIEEDVTLTSENQINSTQESDVKDVILTEEITHSDPIPVGNLEVTEVKAETQTGLEDLLPRKDLGCESKASSTGEASETDTKEAIEQHVTITREMKNDSVDETPTEERIPAVEDATTLEPQVNVSNIEFADSTSGSETSPVIASEGKSEEKVQEQPSVVCLDNEETLEPYGELKPTSESMIEDQVSETMTEPEQSDTAPEENVTLTPENQINSTQDHNETVKNVILTEEIEQVPVEMENEKEKGRNEVKEQVSEDDGCPKELNKTSTSSQKELATEMSSSKPISFENTEVTEVKAKGQIELENIQAAEDLRRLSKASCTTGASKTEMGEDIEHTVTIAGEVKDDSIDKAPKDAKTPAPEDAKTLEPQVNLPETECPNSPSYNQYTQEINEEKGVLISHLTDREILAEEGDIESKKEAPNLEFEKEKKDNELISEIQTPEAILKTEVKEEHIEAANDTYKTLGGGLSSEKKLVSMVSYEESTSLMAEDQTNELVLEENKETKSGNEVVEDVIVNEVVEVEMAEESRSIKDSTNKEASCIENQLASATDEVSQMKRFDSSPNQVLETKGSVEATEDLELTAENLNLKTETLPVIGPNEDVKQNIEETANINTSEFERLEKMVTQENIIKTDADKEKETLDEPDAEGTSTTKSTSEPIFNSIEQDMEVIVEDSRGHGDMHKLEEETTEGFENTSKGAENVMEGREIPAMLIENLQEASCETLPEKHDPEDDTLLSQNDEKIEDSLIQPSVESKVDEILKEAPVIEGQNHGKGLDYTTKERSVDATDNADCSETEHLNMKEVTLESISQETQSEQKKEAHENIESEISSEKAPKQTTVDTEVSNEPLVVSVAKEQDRSSYTEDSLKEQEYYGGRAYQDLEAAIEPLQTEELSDKVQKADLIVIQEETMTKGNLHEEETEERTNIIEATIELYPKEKGNETIVECISTEAATPIEDINKSDTELNHDMDNKPEAYEAEKEILKEDLHLEPTGDRSKITEEISQMKQEPLNVPLTSERSMEFDAPVIRATAVTEGLEISQNYVTIDPTKASEIPLEIQKQEDSAHTMDKQLPHKSHRNESTESKLLTADIDTSGEQGEPTAKSLNAEAEDLKATKALETKPQCSSEVFKDEKKMNDEKENSETAKPAEILFTDELHESIKGNSQVAENLIEEKEPVKKKDQQEDKEENGGTGVETDKENEDMDNQKMASCSDAPVMVEASADIEVKVHKKSHNILSGVGSKVKHSIAKVKKAITGKSSHPKPPSPKQKDEVIT